MYYSTAFEKSPPFTSRPISSKGFRLAGRLRGRGTCRMYGSGGKGNQRIGKLKKALHDHATPFFYCGFQPVDGARRPKQEAARYAEGYYDMLQDQAFFLIRRSRMSISRKSCHEHPNSHGQVTASPRDMKE